MAGTSHVDIAIDTSGKQAARQAAKQARKAKQAAKQAARQQAKAAQQQAKAAQQQAKAAQQKSGTAAKSGSQPKPTGTQPSGTASSQPAKGGAGAAALSWVSQHVTGGGRAKAKTQARAQVAKPSKPVKLSKPSPRARQQARQAKQQARQQAKLAKQQARQAAKQAKLAAKQAKRAARKGKAKKPPVAAVAPGARAASSPTGRSEHGRTVAHVFALAPVITASVMQLQLTFLLGANASRAVFLAAGGVATLAGLASFATLFGLRKYHWKISRHFFGLGIAMALAKTAYEAPAGLGKGDIPWLSLMAFLLLANAAGAIVETVRRRRSGGNP